MLRTLNCIVGPKETSIVVTLNGHLTFNILNVKSFPLGFKLKRSVKFAKKRSLVNFNRNAIIVTDYYF